MIWKYRRKTDTGKDGLVDLYSGPAGWVGSALTWCFTYQFDSTACQSWVGVAKGNQKEGMARTGM